MTTRIRQRITLGDNSHWVSGRNQRELVENAVNLTLAYTTAPSPATKPTHDFQSYAETWLTLYKVNCLKHTTLREYTSLLNKHLIPAFGAMDISAITTDDVPRFMNSKADMSRKSIHEMVMVLGMILESAVEDGFLPRNPARSKRLKNPSRKVSPRHALTSAELADIIEHLPMLSEERDRMTLALLIYTGMRRDEVLGLRWEDIDLAQGLIFVRRGVTYKGNQPCIDTPKTAAGIRMIPLPIELRTHLRPEAPLHYLVGGQDKPISEKTFIRMWQRIGRLIDLHGATPHVFRHTYMTMAQRANVSMKTLQTIGGYSDLATLQDRYVHTQQEDIEAARNTINHMFPPRFVPD
jgi:integrase